MTSDLIFSGGILICIATVVGTIVAAITLRFYKMRLNKRLDADFGKRRH